MYTLSNYNDTGILIVTPEADLSADRQALNSNFIALADLTLSCVQNPMTANLDAGGFDISNIGASGDNPALSVNAGAATSLDGGAVATDGRGNLSLNGTTSGPILNLNSKNGSINFVDTAVYLCSGIYQNGSGSWAFSADFWSFIGLADTFWDGVIIQIGTASGGTDETYTTQLALYADGDFAIGGSFNSPGDNGYITSSSGRILIGQSTTDDTVSALQVSGGATSLDGGAITTDGLGTLCLHPQGSPPTPVAGGIYFDGTYFYVCKDGSTWTTLI
jgi:hypothetical protein